MGKDHTHHSAPQNQKSLDSNENWYNHKIVIINIKKNLPSAAPSLKSLSIPK